MGDASEKSEGSTEKVDSRQITVDSQRRRCPSSVVRRDEAEDGHAVACAYAGGRLKPTTRGQVKESVWQLFARGIAAAIFAAFLRFVPGARAGRDVRRVPVR
jgi:hypothetical protein